jgi:hypothetical protein
VYLTLNMKDYPVFSESVQHNQMLKVHIHRKPGNCESF